MKFHVLGLLTPRVSAAGFAHFFQQSDLEIKEACMENTLGSRVCSTVRWR